ncbi:MAG: hypothetical protein ABSG76_27305 [Xanthobacteraceae bacterium]
MTPRLRPLTAIGLAALAGANVCLLAVVAGGVLGNHDSPIGPLDWSPRLATSGDGTPQPKPIADYPQTLAHPVFFKSRAPFVAPPPAPPAIAKPAAAPVSPDPGLTLAGVMIGEGHRKAYLVSKADSRGTWVKEGETASGWIVQSVTAAAVNLRQRDFTVELQLYPPP